MVIPLDPVYSFLGRNLDEFKKNVAEANLKLKEIGPEKGHSERGMEKAYEDIKTTPLKVAASHQNLPFKEGSFDLILAHNSILQFKDREITRRALQEISQVLTPKGEIRILPGDIRWDSNADSFYVHTFESPTPETLEEAQKLGLQIGPDKKMFSILKELEENGFTIYIAESAPRGSQPRSLLARRFHTPSYSLIIRRDQDVPHMQNFSSFYKLSFKESKDGYHVPSTDMRPKIETK